MLKKVKNMQTTELEGNNRTKWNNVVGKIKTLNLNVPGSKYVTSYNEKELSSKNEKVAKR